MMASMPAGYVEPDRELRDVEDAAPVFVYIFYRHVEPAELHRRTGHQTRDGCISSCIAS